MMVMLVYQQAAVLWPLEVPMVHRPVVVSRRQLRGLDRESARVNGLDREMVRRRGQALR